MADMYSAGDEQFEVVAKVGSHRVRLFIGEDEDFTTMSAEEAAWLGARLLEAAEAAGHQVT